MGNGILTFMHSAAGYQRFFSDAQAVFFDDDAQLQQQLRHFQHDDAARKQVARRRASNLPTRVQRSTGGPIHDRDHL